MSKFISSIALAAALALPLSSAFAQSNQAGFIAAQASDQLRASQLMGAGVKNGAGETIGDVNDVLFDSSNKITAIIVGVGGFLGLGEKNVAISASEIQLAQDENNNRIVTIAATREQLQAAPEFKAIGGKTISQRVQDAQDAAGRAYGTAKRSAQAGYEQAKETAGKTYDQAKRNVQAGYETAKDAVTGDDASQAPNQMADAKINREPQPEASDAPGLVITAVEADKWVGKRIYDRNGSDIGEIAQFKTGADGNVEYFHSDIGGFLGIGETSVQVKPSQFRMDGDRVLLNLTKDEAMKLPRVDS